MREWKQLISINLVLVMLLGNLLPLAAAFEPAEEDSIETPAITEETEVTEPSEEALPEQSLEAPEGAEALEELKDMEVPEAPESTGGPVLAASATNYPVAVDVLSAMGLLMDNFAADQNFTRAMAAQLICRLLLSPDTANELTAAAAPFTDVAADDPYAGYIAYCAKEGIIAGNSEGAFLPEGTISGYAVWKLLLGALGYDAEKEGYTGASWSINVAKQGLELGLDAGLNGDFAGSGAATQEEACLYTLNMLTMRPVKYEAGYSVKIDDVVITVPERVKADPDYTSYAEKIMEAGAAGLEWTYEEGANGLALVTYTVDGDFIGICEREMPDEEAEEEVLFEEVLLEAAQAGLFKYFQPAEWDADYEMTRLDLVKLCAAFLEAKGELNVSDYSPDDITFTDKNTMLDTEQELVAAVTGLGIMGGYEDGSFKPAEKPTRGAVTKILCNLLLGPTAAAALTADAAPFADVAQDHTFAGYIAYCKAKGIVYGDTSSEFHPAAASTERAVLEWFLDAQRVSNQPDRSGTFGALSWVLDENNCLTISGSGSEPDCTNAPWLAYSSEIQTVVIEDGVTQVGRGAFAGCALTAVTLPDSITSIEPCAFANSTLPEITISRNVLLIAGDAFMGCPSDFLIRAVAGSAAARYAAEQNIRFEAIPGGPDDPPAADNYQEAVDVLFTIGMIMDDFAAGQPFTRAMAAQLISRMTLTPAAADELTAAEAPFLDVGVDDPYAGYIAYCKQEGLMGGYEDGAFRPDNDISGYAVFKLLLCVLGYDADREGYNGSNWAINVAKQGLELGLDAGLNGDFDGNGAATQEEACLYALNALKAQPVRYSDITIGDVVVSGVLGADPNYTSYADKLFSGSSDRLTWRNFKNGDGEDFISYQFGGKQIGIYQVKQKETASEDTEFSAMLTAATQAGLLNYFQPAAWDADYNMTRLDIAKLCAAFLEAEGSLDISTYSPDAAGFTDIATLTDTEKQIVAALTDMRILGGYQDGSFGPDIVPTRAAVTKVLCNALLGPTAAGALTADAAPFADVAQDHTFAGYIAYCKAEEIVSGDANDEFHPAAVPTEKAVLKWFLLAMDVDVSADPDDDPTADAEFEAILTEARDIGLLNYFHPATWDADYNMTRLDIVKICAAFLEEKGDLAVSDYSPDDINFTDMSSLLDEEKRLVAALTGMGIMGGYQDGSFGPGIVPTRAAVTKVLCNALLGPTAAGALTADAAPFADVAQDHTFAGYIAYCKAKEIVGGDASDEFHPGAAPTEKAVLKWFLLARNVDVTADPDDDPAADAELEALVSQAEQSGLLDYFRPAEWNADYEMTRLDIVKLCAALLEAEGDLSISDYSPDDADFTDISALSDAEKQMIAALAHIGIIGGYSDGSFQPDAVLTRAAITKILCNVLLGVPAANALAADAAPFADVPQDHVFAGYIAYCKGKSIVSGDASNEFHPGAPATEKAVLKWFLQAQAAYTQPRSGVFGNVFWTLDESNCLTIDGAGSMPDCTNAPWLAYKNSIQKVVIEEGITSVGMGAFAGCALTGAELPEGIESIEPQAFAGSALPEITLGRSVTKIAVDAFLNCPSGFKICGFEGSAAARYAAAQGIDFEEIAVTPEDWPVAWEYPEAVDVLFATGILPDSFSPGGTLQRKEAAQMLARLALSPEIADALTVAEDPFEDMTADDLYAGYAEYCVDQDLLSGILGSDFWPDSNMVKSEFMEALLIILGYEDLVYDEVESFVLNLGLTSGLKDSYSHSGYLSQEEACRYVLNALKMQPVITSYDDETGDVAYTPDPAYTSYAHKLFGSGDQALTWSSTVNTFGGTVTTYVYQGTTIGTYGPEILDTANDKEADFEALITAAYQNGLLKYFQPAEWNASQSVTRIDLAKLCAGFLESENRLHLENYAPEDLTAYDSDKLSALEQQLTAAVIGAGVLNYSGTRFNPATALDRCDTVQELCNLLLGTDAAGELFADTAPFSDVYASNFYAGYIAYCAGEGIVYGYPNGSFAPYNTVTLKTALEWLLRAKGIYVPTTIEGTFNGVKWVVDKEGCLTLSDSGAMPDCTKAPWRFYNCSFDRAVIEDGITTVGAGAFEGCKLTAVDLPYSVTAIGARAFAAVDIPEITLHYEVTDIGEDAFADCPETFFIRGYSDSAAEAYAEEHNITFVPFPEEEVANITLHGGSLLSQFFKFVKRLVGDVLTMDGFTQEVEEEYRIYASNANLDTWNAKIVSWNTNEDGTGLSYATSAVLMLYGDMEAYAQWEIPEFTVDGQSYSISEPVSGAGWTYDPAAEYQLRLTDYTGGGLEFPREVNLYIEGTCHITGDIYVYGDLEMLAEDESALTLTGNIRAGAALQLRTGEYASWTVNGDIHSWKDFTLRVENDSTLTVNGNLACEKYLNTNAYSQSVLTVNGSVVAEDLYFWINSKAAVSVKSTDGSPAIQVEDDFDCSGDGPIRISSTGPCAVTADRSYFSGVHDLEISAAEKALEGKFSHNASRQHLYLEPNGTPVKGSYRGGPYLRLEAAKWTLTLYANGGTWEDQTGEALVIETTMGSSVWLDSYSDDVSRTGSILNGWENRVTETVLPLDHSIYATGSNLELYAQWISAGMLRIGGGEYDPDTAHDYSNGKTSGWRYDPSNSTKRLYLYDYAGGEIFLPYNTYIYLSGSNTVTSTSSATAAISSTKDLYFQKNYNNDGFGPYALTVQGGNGMPAIEANRVQLNQGTTVTLTGGSGAPAVHAMERLSIDTGHATLTGGSDAPAFYTSGGNLYAYSSDVRFFAGESAETAVEMSSWDYDGEHCIITKPIYHTLRLDANGGKANGRGVLELRMEAGESFQLEDLDMYRGNDIFSHWENAEGDEYSYSINIWEDTELTAQWITLPYEDYVVLDCQGVGTIDGERTSYLELPAAGSVTFPTPQIKAQYQDQYIFFSWQGQASNGSWVTVPAGVPFDAGLFEPGMTLWAAYTQTPMYCIYLDMNGVASSNGESLISRRSNSNPVSINRWDGSRNAEGLVIDSWNTKPDGSGISYQPGDSVTVEAGVYNTMLYAQWKPILTYTTVSANEILPSWNNTIKAYVRNKNGSNVSSMVAWRNADGTEFYVPGERCGLPAGTTLYAFCGDIGTDTNIWLYGNGATEPVTVMPSSMWSESLNDEHTAFRYYTVLGVTGYVRPGYKLTGWNTRADGSGEFYAVDHQFYYGTETQGSDGYWNMEYDEAALAAMPDKLYAQWEKIPDVEIPVPEDMRQEENAVIYVAIYDANGSFVGIQVVPPEEEWFGLYDTESGMTYRFFCLADDGTEIPLAEAESGVL